jgi:hypothetical protein
MGSNINIQLGCIEKSKQVGTKRTKRNETDRNETKRRYISLRFVSFSTLQVPSFDSRFSKNEIIELIVFN